MGLNALIEKNRTVATVVAVVVLAIAVVILTKQFDGSQRSTDAFFYDLTTGNLVSAEAVGIAPITLPNGNLGARAYVYSCGACTESERYVAYIEKYTDEAKAELTKEFPNHEIIGQGLIIAAPADELLWTSIESPEGTHLIMAAMSQCEKPTACKP